MLRMIEVRNLALIDNLAFYPGEGLNVISGETGAGKSMLVGAIELLLGERASEDSIRSGEDAAFVEAVLSVDKELLAGLEGIEPDADGSITLSREIRRSGPNVCRVNGRVRPLSVLSAVARQCIDLHGQNSQQSLLDSQSQRKILDAYGQEETLSLCSRVAGLYRERQALQKKLMEYGGDERELARRADFLRFQLAEIESARLSAQEEEELTRAYRRLRNAANLFEKTGRAYSSLYEGYGEESILDRLAGVEKELAAALALDEDLSQVAEQLSAAVYQLKEAAAQLRAYRENIVADEGELKRVSERLELYRSLKKKYGPTVEDVLNTAETIKAELAEMESREKLRARAEQELSDLERRLKEAADLLSDARQKTARKLAAEIEAVVHTLALGGARFLIKVEDAGQIHEHGQDRVTFLFSANRGEELLPMSKIASGGEVARLMLAVKSVLARQDRVPTLVFDEVDAGIGGITVKSVASRLKLLSRHHQVICVTHQPLVAAAADHHFTIFKQEKEARTVTRLTRVTGEERLQEVARMLGGQDRATIDLAREMLQASY